MSNKTAAPAAAEPAPAKLDGVFPLLDGAPSPGIKIRHLRFISKGMIIASPKEAEEQVIARTSDDAHKGYDIWYVESRRAFRFDRYDGGVLRVVKYVPEHNVVVYEEWDQPSSVA